MVRFGLKHPNLPFELPAGPSEIEFLVQVNRPSDFAATVTLFLDDDGLREVQLNMHGTATDNKENGKHHATR